MFLHKALKDNRPLIEFGFQALQEGKVLPDSYLIDVDAMLDNAQKLLQCAKENGLHIYFMLKQAGRNPYLAKRLCDMGYDGAVAVDFEEALGYVKHGIKLGHVGHLVQIPNGALETILQAKPEIMTVYSVEKAVAVSKCAQNLGIIQNIMLKVVGKEDSLFSGQYGGFRTDELKGAATEIMKLKGVKISGVCSFPCFLYNDISKQIEPTNNAKTVLQASELLQELGCEIKQINMPSANSLSSIKTAAMAGATHIEPGHAMFGTTPYNANSDVNDEKPTIIYLSEISHNFDGKAYCYGGGYYRRGHLANALVGKEIKSAQCVGVIPPDDDSIDYNFGLDKSCSVGDAVIMSFRTQIFVTRSRVVLVGGLSKNMPEIIGVYNSLGERCEL